MSVGMMNIISYEEPMFVNESANVSVPDNLNETDLFIPYHKRVETYVVPLLFALIFIVGILGNGTLIIIFVRNKNLRNVPNTYIINLAIGDILVLIISLPFTSTIYTIESWPYGEFICRSSEFIKDLSIGVSVFTLTALSADRYFAIVAPMRRHMGADAGQGTIVIAISIWILSVTLALPTMLLSHVKHVVAPDIDFKVCYPYPDDFWAAYPQLSVIAKFLCYYMIPLLIISGFYLAMARHLVISSRNMPGEPQGQQSRQIEARKKVAKVVLSFVVIFAVCFFPNHVFLIWFYFDENAHSKYDDFWHAWRIIGFCLTFINSCINPIALYCVSGVFRKYYNDYLFCCLVSNAGARRKSTHTFDGRSTMVNFNSTFRRTSTSMSMLQSASV